MPHYFGFYLKDFDPMIFDLAHLHTLPMWMEALIVKQFTVVRLNERAKRAVEFGKGGTDLEQDIRGAVCQRMLPT